MKLLNYNFVWRKFGTCSRSLFFFSHFVTSAAKFSCFQHWWLSAPYHVRKQLVESLAMSKLHYGCIVFYPLPEYQMKRLQRVQTTCAGYVLGVCCFRGLAEIKLASNYKKEIPSTTENHSYSHLRCDVWPD